MRKISLAALLFIHCALAFAQYTPATVPNTKLVDNSYVSNPDGVISANAAAQINAALLDLETKTSSQVAVVVLKSIGDADIFDFAQELFNLWGIGSTNSNGLLILLVEDQHTVRFHTGYGLEGVLPDVVCKTIQREQMVPSFKAGDYDTGMINGVAEVVKILTDPNYAAELKAADVGEESGGYSSFVIFVAVFLAPIFLIAWASKSGKFRDSKPADPTDYPQMRLKRLTWLIEFGGMPLLIVVLYGVIPMGNAIGSAFFAMYFYLMATVFHRAYRERKMTKEFLAHQKYFELTEYFRKSAAYWIVMGLIFPFPFLLYIPIHIVRKGLFRNHSRNCKECGGEMKKLGEEEDDQYLTRAQLVEEQIKSINYDVWKCQSCSATQAWHFPYRFSGYEECPFCKAKAYYRESHRTIKSATYSSSGKGEEVHACKACGKKKTSTYTIAQLVRSSSSGSSGGSSWSSSSGGSWGGGRSGGGGASSSW